MNILVFFDDNWRFMLRGWWSISIVHWQLFILWKNGSWTDCHGTSADVVTTGRSTEVVIHRYIFEIVYSDMTKNLSIANE